MNRPGVGSTTCFQRGDNHYYKVEWRGSKFFPIAEFQDQVLAVIGRTGVVDSFGDSAKPTTNTLTNASTGHPDE